MIDPKDMKEFIEGYGEIAPTFLRDLFACAAMKALLENPLAAREISRDAEQDVGHRTGIYSREIALNAYDFADAMLWAREVSAADNRAVKEGVGNG